MIGYNLRLDPLMAVPNPLYHTFVNGQDGPRVRLPGYGLWLCLSPFPVRPSAVHQPRGASDSVILHTSLGRRINFNFHVLPSRSRHGSCRSTLSPPTLRPRLCLWTHVGSSMHLAPSRAGPQCSPLLGAPPAVCTSPRRCAGRSSPGPFTFVSTSAGE